MLQRLNWEIAWRQLRAFHHPDPEVRRLSQERVDCLRRRADALRRFEKPEVRHDD